MKSIPRILTLATTILFSVVSQAQIYVSIEGGGDGSSWKNTTTLSEALNRARAGEQIWVRGYENANEKQILEKAYNEYLDLKKSNLWGSRKYF